MTQKRSDFAERLAWVSGLVVVGLLIFVIWQRTALAAIFAIFPILYVTITSLKYRRLGQEEMKRQLGETKDDPSEMARWVP